MDKLSILAMFDELRRNEAVLTEGTAEIEFLRFVQYQEAVRQQWENAVHDAQRLQYELDVSLKSLAGLESKLQHARRLLEMENKARRKAENELEMCDKKMKQVFELLKNEREFKSETLDKIEFLNEYRQKRKSNRLVKESKGNEINTTGSFLSDLSLTQSEDDFLDVGPAKAWKKHRPSYNRATNQSFIGTKRKSVENRSEPVEFIESAVGDKIVARTKVSIPQGSGPIQAESIIESVPQIIESEPMKCSPKKPLSPKCAQETPKRYQQTPTAPPMDLNHKKFQSLSSRPHKFTSKSSLKWNTCAQCQKGIKFGCFGLKCSECRIWIHSGCKGQLTMLCAPSVHTPTSKGQIGTIGDYTPVDGPMIPGLIVHCVNEIESRGLSEVGIYRLSGSERDVKALKERFMNGRHIPPLSNLDIHVICGCIKDFLRSLREPLIPTDLWRDFSNAAQNPRDKESDLYSAIAKLPKPNRDTLAFLILHFQRVASCIEIKMPVTNIAKIFGPTIVGYSSADPDIHAIFTETTIQSNVMEELIKIPTDYWLQFINVHVIMNDDGMTDGHIERTPSRSHCFYGTPTLHTSVATVKRRKFFDTPPYPEKK